MANITVTVPKSYSFTVNLEEADFYRENYGIEVVAGRRGSFHVTGPEAKVESFVDDTCIGDRASVSAIMRTAR